MAILIKLRKAREQTTDYPAYGGLFGGGESLALKRGTPSIRDFGFVAHAIIVLGRG